MNQTMSSSSEWMHFYNQSFSGQPVHPPGHHLTSSPLYGGADRVSDATVVTTAVPTATTTNPLGSGNSSPTATTSNLSPEGRVSKPARKRSRASRRTPTTLLNTDTANFRAMVQQFTGGPSAPFGSVSHPGGGVSFGFVGGGGGGTRQNFINPMMVPAGFQLQQQQQHVFNQLQQQQNQNQQQGQGQGQGQGQYLQFGLSNGSNTPAVDGFLQRLSSGGRPSNGNGGGGGVSTEGFMNIHEHGVSTQVVARPSSGSNENRSNTSFMF